MNNISYHEKSCVVCGKTFKPKSPVGKNCSKECAEIREKSLKHIYNKFYKETWKEKYREYNRKRKKSEKYKEYDRKRHRKPDKNRVLKNRIALQICKDLGFDLNALAKEALCNANLTLDELVQNGSRGVKLPPEQFSKEL